MRLDGFVIDIARGRGRSDELLIEIQTGSFAAMGNKLDHLLAEHRMLVVHPIATETILERDDRPRRRSPKRGSIYSLFDELVSIPTLLDHPNLELDVVLVAVVKAQQHDQRARRGRGGYRTVDRRLDRVIETRRFRTVTDLLSLLPADLPATFTTADLAAGAGINRDDAQRLAYCFRAACLFDAVSRDRAGIHYRISG